MPVLSFDYAVIGQPWGSRLTTLPETFGLLAALQTLHLNDNELATLPESFGQLAALQTLYLGRSKLATLRSRHSTRKVIEAVGELSKQRKAYITTTPQVRYALMGRSRQTPLTGRNERLKLGPPS